MRSDVHVSIPQKRFTSFSCCDELGSDWVPTSSAIFRIGGNYSVEFEYRIFFKDKWNCYSPEHTTVERLPRARVLGHLPLGGRVNTL